MAEPERVFLAGRGARLSCLRAGPVGGEPVLLLHGFPEGAKLGWRRQIGPLAAAGLRVWAPDQRGYGESDRPSRVGDYRLDLLAGDARALLGHATREAGGRRVHLVGHDWGGAVAWWTALASPERLASLTILNCPHPLVFRRALLLSPRQLLRSWYMLWFQLPWLPERLAGADHGASVARSLRKTARPDTFSDDDLDRYRLLLGQPGALRAMIHWYRALRYTPSPPEESPDLRVRVPTQILWGAKDRFIGREFAARSAALCDTVELRMVEEATHWVQHEEAERVNAWITGWVQAHPGA
jgi:epoxide hydrolase 4